MRPGSRHWCLDLSSPRLPFSSFVNVAAVTGMMWTPHEKRIARFYSRSPQPGCWRCSSTFAHPAPMPIFCMALLSCSSCGPFAPPSRAGSRFRSISPAQLSPPPPSSSSDLPLAGSWSHCLHRWRGPASHWAGIPCWRPSQAHHRAAGRHECALPLKRTRLTARRRPKFWKSLSMAASTQANSATSPLCLSPFGAALPQPQKEKP